jgi:hypothetical protein
VTTLTYWPGVPGPVVRPLTMPPLLGTADADAGSGSDAGIVVPQLASSLLGGTASSANTYAGSVT